MNDIEPSDRAGAVIFFGAFIALILVGLFLYVTGIVP